MKSRPSVRPESDDEQPRLAVLIDADNAQPAVIEGLLAEVAKYGVASVKRIYGDFTSTRMTQWKQALLKHSINPVQQFAYTSGKNATDSSLIIDAMDLMYTGRFDGVCLVSSDSDFTRLAQRLREEGLTVYGFGERKTPDAFVQACDKFIYVEVLRSEASAPAAPPPPKPAKKAARPAAKKPAGQAEPTAAPVVEPARHESLPLKLIRQAIEEASDDQGWAFLGSVGSYLSKVRPDFDTRLYGHKKLSDLMKAHPRHFTVEERAGEGGAKRFYVRSA
ncbi:NYN domain-containing protein [Pseudoxanthomonas sp. F37]|uniref:NYN domain-containing protein n=1 Tax=Pseudoxanthomonas TaxID=83618 RepID=UPI001FD53F72|nr:MULTISPECIES: NYN domain-containing protein [Pseudoxanthomonas]UOV03904.1 NYN domain-containing protein [Pseudoxanthomonas mexicana]UOV08903.1 NYN domain-containing protein [Pseudoxanthomonas sp. F37]